MQSDDHTARASRWDWNFSEIAQIGAAIVIGGIEVLMMASESGYEISGVMIVILSAGWLSTTLVSRSYRLQRNWWKSEAQNAA